MFGVMIIRSKGKYLICRKKRWIQKEWLVGIREDVAYWSFDKKDAEPFAYLRSAQQLQKRLKFSENPPPSP